MAGPGIKGSQRSRSYKEWKTMRRITWKRMCLVIGEATGTRLARRGMEPVDLALRLREILRVLGVRTDEPGNILESRTETPTVGEESVYHWQGGRSQF